MMKIKRNIYVQLLGCPLVPPETGGILGQRENIIDTVVVDRGEPSENGGSYKPDVSFLNNVIRLWEKEGIIFAGIFHTHANCWMGLSAGDRKYIREIIIAMPEIIQMLYFPIVYPSLYFIKAFVAIERDEKLQIFQDTIEII